MVKSPDIYETRHERLYLLAMQRLATGGNAQKVKVFFTMVGVLSKYLHFKTGVFLITNLQLLRVFAALSVVFYYTDFTIAGGTEFFEVLIFFCISGFVMTHIVHEAPDNF